MKKSINLNVPDKHTRKELLRVIRAQSKTLEALALFYDIICRVDEKQKGDLKEWVLTHPLFPPEYAETLRKLKVGQKEGLQ